MYEYLFLGHIIMKLETVLCMTILKDSSDCSSECKTNLFINEIFMQSF